MVTNYPTVATATAAVDPERPEWRDRLLQILCGLTGHDRLTHYGQDRLSLRCVACGHETPGWDLK